MLKLAIRSWLRQPALAIAAGMTLALGIGASTALFSAFKAVLLEPLPYPRPSEIYTVRTYYPNGRFTIGLVATEEMYQLAGLSDAVQSVAMAARRDAALITDAGPRQVVAYAVSEQFFPLFDVEPARGRWISADDDVKGAPRVAVLSNALWVAAYGGRPDVVGLPIQLGPVKGRIIGVAPPQFAAPVGADLWVNEEFPPSIGHGYDGYVRLRPRVTPASLAPRLADAMAALGRKYPDQSLGRAYRLQSLLDSTVGDLGPIVTILFAATTLLLVLASVNVANLLLARSTSRMREFGVMSALGAGRRRLFAQLGTEALLLSLGGGVAGVAGAFVVVRVLMHYGGSRLPRLDALSFDPGVLAFAALLVAVTGIGIGMAPALRLAGADVRSVLNDGGRSVKGSRRAALLSRAFIVAEIAACVALVAGAARLVRAYEQLRAIDPGFDPRGRLVLNILFPANDGYVTGPRLVAWWQAGDAALRRAGATQVAAASSLPFQHEWDNTTFVDLASRPDVPPEQRPNARERFVTPDFFGVMGMRLVAGRRFEDHDGPGTQPVAIVNEAFVRRNLAGGDPLREQILSLRFRRAPDGRFVPDPVFIVGVVSDVRYASLTLAPEPIVYMPLAQVAEGRQSIVVRTPDAFPATRLPAVEAAVRSVDSSVLIAPATMDALIDGALERQRLGTVLMSAFGAAALLLAVVGMFGVLAFLVSQRTAEMAVRQAFGATRARVFRMVVGNVAGVAAIGLLLGTVLAWWMGAMMSRYVYAVSPADPVVLTASAALVALCALCATIIPARRAAMLEPATALRQT
jgi:putative ABC transport system permease protein